MKKANINKLARVAALIIAVFLSAGAKASADWTVNPADYRYDMSLYFNVFSVDVEDFDYDRYEIAAFYGDECRGVAEVMSLPSGEECLYMRIRSNTESGENIMFRARNKETLEIAGINETVSFESGTRIGFPSEPYSMTVKEMEKYAVTVTASDGGNVNIQSGSYIEGTELHLIAAPDEGYSFLRWNDGNTDNPRTIIVDSDISLEAVFEANTYKAVFKIDEDVISVLDVVYGDSIVAPDVPEREGYTFSGWVDLPAVMPAHDIEVYGSYEANMYRLVYEIDGELYKEYDVAYGSAITAEPAPEKEGHTFSGWSGLPETMPAHDVTVTGSFSINTYSVTFKIGEDVISVLDVVYGDSIVAPDVPEREGYTFSGWVDLPAVMPAHDIEVYGSYEANMYRLVYEVDGELYKEDSVAYGSVITAEPAPEKEGHTFSGWSGLPETMPAHDVTVTGSFSINTYVLTVYLDDEIYMKEELEYGEEVVIPDPEVPVGWKFDGWIEEIPATMPAHDVEIHGTTSEIDSVESIIAEDEPVDIYTIDGCMMYVDVKFEEVKDRLAPGFYIVNGRKLMIR